MKGLIDIKLPDEVMDNLPDDFHQMVTYLSGHLDKVVSEYELNFSTNVRGTLGGPLSRFERSLLKDFLFRMVLGERLHAAAKGNEPAKIAAPT